MLFYRLHVVLQHESSPVEQRKLQSTLNKIEKLVQKNQTAKRTPTQQT
jgi:hypothetical protein